MKLLMIACLLSLFCGPALSEPLTPVQRKVLNHGIVDADAWWERIQSLDTLKYGKPDSTLARKLRKLTPAYEAAKADTTKPYMTRAQRDSVEEAKRLAIIAATPKKVDPLKALQDKLTQLEAVIDSIKAAK